MIPARERRIPAFVARERVSALRAVLGLPPDTPDPAHPGPVGLVQRLLAECRSGDHWVVCAVMTASMPSSLFVDEVTRAVRLGDVARAADMLVVLWIPTDHDATVVVDPDTPYIDVPYASVRLLVEPVLVDVYGLDDPRVPADTRRASAALVESAPPRAVRVTWSDEYRALVKVDGPANDVVVPYGGAYLLPGICDQPPRAARLMSLARSSSTAVVGVGYGLGPLNAVELNDDVEKDGVEQRRHAWHTATERVMRQVVAVSDTAHREMQGWKSMLPALGVTGPQLVAGHLGTDPLAVAVASGRGRVLVSGSNSAVGGFPTVARALAFLPADLRPVEVLRLQPADGTSIDFAVEGISTAPVVDLGSLRSTDVVVSCSSSSSHDIRLESLLAAGIRGVVAESGFGHELARYGTCRLVPRRDAIAVALALEVLLRATGPAPLRPDADGRRWVDFTDLVWDRVLAGAGGGGA